MNQHDRSITQFDLALIRRFDHIDLVPSSEMVEDFLGKSGKFAPEQIDRIVKWFEALQRLLPFGIGHTYFKDVARPDVLQVVWRHRMLPYCEAVLELEPERLDDVRRSFEGMFSAVTGHGTTT
jgi:5-methylcytosine-specific restriction enzyme B